MNDTEQAEGSPTIGIDSKSQMLLEDSVVIETKRKIVDAIGGEDISEFVKELQRMVRARQRKKARCRNRKRVDGRTVKDRSRINNKWYQKTTERIAKQQQENSNKTTETM